MVAAKYMQRFNPMMISFNLIVRNLLARYSDVTARLPKM